MIIGYRIKLPTRLIVLIYQTTFAGHRVTTNDRLTHLGEMPGVGGPFARVDGFRPSSLHVKSCSTVYDTSQKSTRSHRHSQELSYHRQKASRLCKIIRYKQHCYGTVRFIIYKSSGSDYYSTMESTFKSQDAACI